MAPEQAEGLEVGEPADLYALALVIYEALTGVNPVGYVAPAAAPGGSGCTCPRCAASAAISRANWRMRDRPARCARGRASAGTMEELGAPSGRGGPRSTTTPGW